MASRIPADITAFSQCFPSWPDDSLANRTDIEAGSRWTIPDIGTFQVLCLKPIKVFPLWLSSEYSEATESIRGSPGIQRAIQLLGTKWRELNLAELIRSSGAFAPFFDPLAEAIEQPLTLG